MVQDAESERLRVEAGEVVPKKGRKANPKAKATAAAKRTATNNDQSQDVEAENSIEKASASKDHPRWVVLASQVDARKPDEAAKPKKRGRPPKDKEAPKDAPRPKKAQQDKQAPEAQQEESPEDDPEPKKAEQQDKQAPNPDKDEESAKDGPKPKKAKRDKRAREDVEQNEESPKDEPKPKKGKRASPKGEPKPKKAKRDKQAREDAEQDEESPEDEPKSKKAKQGDKEKPCKRTPVERAPVDEAEKARRVKLRASVGLFEYAEFNWYWARDTLGVKIKAGAEKNREVINLRRRGVGIEKIIPFALKAATITENAKGIMSSAVERRINSCKEEFPSASLDEAS
eukprot:s17_g9.t1